MLSQQHVTGEKFTVDASTSVYVFFYLQAICENVQPKTYKTYKNLAKLFATGCRIVAMI